MFGEVSCSLQKTINHLGIIDSLLKQFIATIDSLLINDLPVNMAM